MAKVVDSWANKKATEDEKQLRSDDVVREEALRLLWHNGAWRFGVGGVHGQNFPPFGEDFPPNRYSYTEIVNDFTNEPDFVKYSDERYVHFLESQVAQLQYKLHLLESGE
jgi:hypothetical protein